MVESVYLLTGAQVEQVESKRHPGSDGQFPAASVFCCHPKANNTSPELTDAPSCQLRHSHSLTSSCKYLLNPHKSYPGRMTYILVKLEAAASLQSLYNQILIFFSWDVQTKNLPLPSRSPARCSGPGCYTLIQLSIITRHGLRYLNQVLPNQRQETLFKDFCLCHPVRCGA